MSIDVFVYISVSPVFVVGFVVSHICFCEPCQPKFYTLFVLCVLRALDICFLVFGKIIKNTYTKRFCRRFRLIWNRFPPDKVSPLRTHYKRLVFMNETDECGFMNIGFVDVWRVWSE